MITLALLSHSPHCTGAERCLFNLAMLLRDVPDIRPVLLIPGREGPLLDMALKHGLAFDCLPSSAWYLFSEPAQTPYREMLARCVSAIKQTLVNHACDGILINTLTNVGGALAAVELNLPAVLWIHGIIDSASVASRPGTWATLNDRLLLETAARIVVNSDWTGRFFSQMMGVQHKMELIYNWTVVRDDVPVSSEKFRQPRCVCFSTFDQYKGYDTLLHAVAILQDRGVTLELDLYGRGSNRNEMQELSRQLHLDEIVRFNERTADVDAVLDRSYCHISPSYVESFGMTIIEAMARKTPVVATTSGGPQEIIQDGVNGFLVAPGNAVDLADKLEYLLQRPDVAQQIGDQGFIRVRDHFSERVARDKFAALIRSALDAFQGYSSAIHLSCGLYQLMLENTTAPEKRSRSIATSRPSPRGYARLRKQSAYRVVPTQPGWNGLEVLIGTHQQPANGALSLRVLTPTGAVVRQTTVDLLGAVDNDWLTFDFPPITNSEGHAFILEFSLAHARPDAKISLFETQVSPGRWSRVRFEALIRVGLRPLRNSLCCCLRYV